METPEKNGIDKRGYTSSGFCEDNLGEICQLLSKPGNDRCADCSSNELSHTNSYLGVFLCKSCAEFHRNLKLNRILPIISQEYTAEDLKTLRDIGNNMNNGFFERRLPPCYRRPTYNEPVVFMEQWIRAKYERKEFVENSPEPSYMARTKEGILWKRGKDSKQFKMRKFVLCKQTKTLKYYVKEGSNSTPKAELNLDSIDAFVVPEKVGNPNGMQIMFEYKGLTRSLFVYAETQEELVSWYTSIYAAKLQWLQIAFPCSPVGELCRGLWPRIVKEGWLFKCGPKRNDKFHSRWVTLLNRKMLYFLDSLDPFPKGEVIIGSTEIGQYWVKVPDTEEVYDSQWDSNAGEKGFVFSIGTPQRTFTFMATSEQARKEWVDAVASVIGEPLLPFEQKEVTRRGTKPISKRFSSLFLK